jgi:hypothetical protein
MRRRSTLAELEARTSALLAVLLALLLSGIAGQKTRALQTIPQRDVENEQCAADPVTNRAYWRVAAAFDGDEDVNFSRPVSTSGCCTTIRSTGLGK